MRITGERESIEACTEAGWEAYDLITEVPLTDDDIEGLKELGGSFMYLKSLRSPFFKLEGQHFLIRGVRGNDFLRVAVHRDYPEELERIKSFLS